MTGAARRPFRRVGAALSLVLAGPAAHAEVIIHGGQILPGPAIEVPASVGEQKGGNLFHSFGVFNVVGGESVSFTGPTGPNSVKNVVSRVTGGTSAVTGLKSSLIDGPVTVDIPGANFYFINPHGVVFGEFGSVHATGSVHISTADMVKLQDGGVFHADPSKTSTLTSAPPSAFGFLGPQAASIELNGPWIGEPFVPPAPVPPGKTFALVGGDIEIRAGAFGGAGIVAPGANVVLASAASAGDVGLTADGGVDLGSLDSFTALGRIDIRGGSFVSVGVDDNFVPGSDEPAGTIAIRGGSLTLAGAELWARTDGQTQGPGEVRNGGVVDIRVTGDLTIGADPDIGNPARIDVLSFSALGAGPRLQLEAGGTLDVSGQALVFAATVGPGDAADLRMRAGRLVVRDAGTQVLADNYGPGPNPSLAIDAGSASFGGGSLVATRSFGPSSGGALVIEAGAVEVRDPGTLVVAENYGDGIGPSLRAEVGSLAVSEGGALSAVNYGLGSGGTLSVSADTLEIRDGGSLLSADNFGDGDGPSLVVQARSLAALDGGFIGSFSAGGAGSAGDVSVTADTTLLVGTGSDTLSLSAESQGGTAGNLSLSTRTLALRDGARISASTGGSGDAGALTVSASEQIRIDGELSGIFSSAGPAATGSAGALNVTTPSLAIDGGVIDSSTVADGDAGDVTVNVASLALTNGGQIRSFSGGVRLDANGTPVLDAGTGTAGSVTVMASGGITASGATAGGAPSGLLVQTRGAGSGGDLRVTTPTLALSDGALIGADTGGTGRGGNVVVNVGTASLGSGARISSGSGITVLGLELPAAGAPGGDGGTVTVQASDHIRLADAGTAIEANTRTSGRGGDVAIAARNLTLENGATISSSSTGSGLAGDVRIALGDTLTLRGASIATQAVTADGGNIRITVPRLIDLIDSRITTSVESGVGGGGNIFIDPDFLILQRSQIIANAFGGPGGNITIIAGQLITDPTSVIEASSALGIDGNVTIDAPNPDVGSNLVVLPENFLDASRLLQPNCGAARAGLSSLVEVGRGGLPPDPDGYLPSAGPVVPAAAEPASAGAASSTPATVLAQLGCSK